MEDDDLATELYRTIDLLQQQLAEEQRSKRRLVAAMRDSRDKSELLSALAYTKLRELWEEKCKWEGDCLELRDRLVELEGSEGSNSL
jgi:chromosome segregation ATPase